MKSHARSLLVRRSAGALLSATLLAGAAQAQFSSTADADLVVANSAFEEGEARHAALPDGSFYVSWRVHDPAGVGPQGYDIFLQRYDSAGVPQWAPGGVLIADTDENFPSPYDLEVDLQGNALIAFVDGPAIGPKQIIATKTSPGGVVLWGSIGALAPSSPFAISPQLCVASDGFVHVAWQDLWAVRLQRLDANGSPTWLQPAVAYTSGYDTTLVDLLPSTGGSVIFTSSVRALDPVSSPEELFISKLDAAQQLLWGSPGIPLATNGTFSKNIEPELLGDGLGGAFLMWVNPLSNTLGRVQHVDAAGNVVFAPGGVEVITDQASETKTLKLAYDRVEQELFAGYTYSTGGSAFQTVGAQKFDAGGNRLWGPTGKTVVAPTLSSYGVGGIESLDKGGVEGIALIWTLDPGGAQNVDLLATRLDDDGTPLGPDTLMSNLYRSGLQLQTEPTQAGNLITLITSDDALTGFNVALQNVLPSGELGGVPVVTPLLGSGANPVALSAGTQPSLGATWQLGLDKASDPTALLSAVFVYGQALAAPLGLPEGELLVDPTSPLIAKSLKTSGLGVDAHAFPVPLEIAFVGLTVHAQGAILGLTGTSLTNGLAATVGL